MINLRKNCITDEELDIALHQATEEFSKSEMAHLNLLLIDDEVGLCEELAFMLEHRGYNVMCANNNAEAKRIILENPIDIVVLDLNLPDGNGLELLHCIKKENKDASVIIMTAYGSLDSAVRAIREEVYDYLAKPIDIDKLFKVLKNAASFRMLSKKLMEKMLFLEQLQCDAINKEFEIIKLKEEIKNLRNHPKVQPL